MLRNANLEKDGEPKGTNSLRFDLCLAIQADIDFEDNYSEVDRNKWPPLGFDFKVVHQRTLDLDKDGLIWGLLANSIVLCSSIAWKSFTARVMAAKCSLNQFSRLPILQKLDIADAAFGG